MIIFKCSFYFRLTFITISFLFCNSLIAGTYYIGTEDIEYYPHYGKSSANSYEFEGFARLFFDDFSIKKDVSIEYVPLPIKRLYFSLLVKQSIDLKYPDSPHWNSIEKTETNEKAYYSKPIVDYFDGIFVHSDNAHITLGEVKILGIIRGFTPEPFRHEINNKTINVLNTLVQIIY